MCMYTIWAEVDRTGSPLSYVAARVLSPLFEKQVVVWSCAIAFGAAAMGMLGGPLILAAGCLATIFAVTVYYALVGDVVP